MAGTSSCTNSGYFFKQIKYERDIFHVNIMYLKAFICIRISTFLEKMGDEVEDHKMENVGFCESHSSEN